MTTLSNSTDRLPPDLSSSMDSNATEEISDYPTFGLELMADSSGTALAYAALVSVVIGAYFQVFPKPVLKLIRNMRILLEDIILVLLCTAFLLSIAAPSGAVMVWRLMVHLYLKWKYGELGGLVEPLDVVGALDTPNSRQVIKSFKVLEGTCDLQSLRASCCRTVGKRTNTNNIGKLVYPKFYQELGQMGGFFCWRPSLFDITHHVRFVDGLDLTSPSQSETQVLRIISQICNDEFKAGRSNWEILVVPKFHYDLEVPRSGIPKFGIIIRVHHSIGDGYSLLKLILKDMAGEMSMSAIPEDTRPSMPLWLGTLVFLYMTIKTPRALLSQLFVKDQNPLHNAKRRTSGKKTLIWSQPISVPFLKETKNRMGSGMSTVLFTALAGGLRKYMLQEFGETPDQVTVVLPMPAPNHPDDKMTNNFSIVLFPLDCMSSDPVLTSKRIADAGKKVARSPVAIGNFFLMAVGGFLPASIVRFFLTNSYATAIVSNLPGPSREISIWGHRLLDTMFWIPSLGDSGLSVSFLSYSNNMRIGLTIDSGVLDKGHSGAQCLIQGITDELMEMARSVGVAVTPEEYCEPIPVPVPIFKIDRSHIKSVAEFEVKAQLNNLNEDRWSAEKTLLISDYENENETPKSLNFLPCSSYVEKVPDSFKSNIVRTKSLSRLTKC